VDVRTLQTVRGRQPDAARLLLHDRPELAQRVEMKVDGPVADPTSAEVGDERLTETVQQRAAEQDRDARRAGVRIDLLVVRRFDIARVEDQRSRLVALGDGDAV